MFQNHKQFIRFPLDSWARSIILIVWTRRNYAFCFVLQWQHRKKTDRHTCLYIQAWKCETQTPLIIKKLITFFIYPIHTDGHIALVYTSGSLEVKLNPRNSRKVSTVGLELKESPSVQNLRSEPELLGRNASVASKSSNLPLWLCSFLKAKRSRRSFGFS